ncbi:MAG: DUF6482 family protein [Halioglobus sp.]
MKRTLKDLASGGHIDRLVIRSMDLSLYIALAEVAGDECLITNNDGSTLKTRNLLDMKQAVSDLPFGELVLRQESAYDEMVGQPGKDGSNALEVGLSAEMYPTPDWQH